MHVRRRPVPVGSVSFVMWEWAKHYWCCWSAGCNKSATWWQGHRLICCGRMFLKGRYVSGQCASLLDDAGRALYRLPMVLALAVLHDHNKACSRQPSSNLPSRSRCLPLCEYVPHLVSGWVCLVFTCRYWVINKVDRKIIQHCAVFSEALLMLKISPPLRPR